MGVTPELTIGIVLFNSADGLEHCLGSIRDDVRYVWAEAIAVENGSRDGSVAAVTRELPRATAANAEWTIAIRWPALT